MQRMLQQYGIDPDTVGQLTRLAMIGDSGMGALSYHPVWKEWETPEVSDLDELAQECQHILNQEETLNADRMFALAGSSGGTKPKVMTPE